MTAGAPGRRVLVTRGAQQASRLCEGLRGLGAIPVEVPVIAIEPPASLGPLDRALGRLEGYDWLILTSANAARVLARRAAELGIDLGAARNLSVAAVGPATAAEAQSANLTVTWTPESYVAESLVRRLVDEARGRRVLLARAAVARDLIPDALRRAGAEVDVVEAYRNVLPGEAPGALREAAARGLDAATFTSSSSVTHLREAAELAGIGFPLDGAGAVSIGPVTSGTLREAGWEPEAEADPHDIPGLIEAVARVLARRSGAAAETP